MRRQDLTPLVALLVLTTLAGCRRTPDASGEAHRDAVVAFHTGIAAMQTSQEVLAREQLERVIALAPDEPAAWANLGLLLLRQQDDEEAADRLSRAEALAPDHAGIQRLQALAAGRRGDLSAAIQHWTRALALDPNDPKAAYALALDLEREGGDANDAQAQRTLEELAARTGNLAAKIEVARLAAKRDDASALQAALATLEPQAAEWPEDIQERFATVQAAAATSPRAAGQAIAFLKNVLLRTPEYRQAVAAVSTPREEVGELVTRLLLLPNPSPRPAPADEALVFSLAPMPGMPADHRTAMDTASLTGEGHPLVVAFDGRVLHLASFGDASPRTVAVQAGGPAAAATPAADGPHVVLPADLDYDFRADIVVAGPLGTRVLRHTDDGGFADVTGDTTLPAQVLARPATGAWAADVDTDGDLDVVIALADQRPLVLRNNGDMTFTAIEPFGEVTALRDFVWVDLDGDGVPDAACLQADGTVRVLVNQRGGSFAVQALPAGFPEAVALAAAETSGDGMLDLIALTASGHIVRLSQRADGAGWEHVEIASASPPTPLTVAGARLLAADLDNNGGVDLVVSGDGWSQVILATPDGTFRSLDAPLALSAHAAADLSGDGRLELIGIGPAGGIVIASSRGERAYHWQTIRPRAATASGDQRINSFGIGGEVEVRTGLHLQKRLITSPIVHVGLGEATQAEVIRLVWPNGTLQSEFNLGVDTAIAATQRLKGSCPWLFAWDGEEVRFVTDVLWRSPLGLRINAQDTADVLMTEDHVKVRGDQLAPRDGHYDLRITAELWETHFFDYVSLHVVDHPEGTEVWVDERFVVPAPSTALIVTGPLQPLASAHDDRGRDVADLLAARDDRHLDFAGRGPYQGVTRAHFVEVALPDTTPREGPVWLIAQGWVHPTDSSINVAISQGAHATPQGLSLQMADASGRFRTVEPNLGFPAGKDKTVLVDLSGHLPSEGPIRLRLATNMEIFWDRMGWAVGRPDEAPRVVRLVPETAELRYRGYSVTGQRDASTPERPRYILEGTTPRWLDLEGYHTRFGDVRELLLGVDDRYVIMNAGDELRLQFAEVPPPGPGQRRDFVFVSDGWEKDGDFNTTFSRTVLPLPTHGTARYDRPPGRLEDDPVYLTHPRDFAEYHTRYVAPDRARRALRSPAGQVQP